MALLPSNSMNCVVSIGIGNDPATRRWIGTGFFYGITAEAEDGYLVFLITNKHVLEGSNQVWLRFNKTSSQESNDYPVVLRDAASGAPRWSAHPTEDVAAFGFILTDQMREAGYDIGFFSDDSMVAEKKQDLKNRGATEGDGIFLLGFPMGLIGQERRYVMCRTGCIARIQDMHEGLSDQFLVDAMVFPGNSGGPVISKPQLTSLQNTQKVTRSKLMGIVQAYVPYREVAVSKQTGHDRVIFEENSGLAVVLPVDFVDEVARLENARLTPSAS